MLRIIDQHTLSLLYSRSGMGKSSLIKAGMIPLLEDFRNFFPVYIRISESLINDAHTTFSKAVTALIKADAGKYGVTIDEPAHTLGDYSLTEFLYFSTLRYQDNTKKGQPTPVLIFDQFEEIFSRGFTKGNIDLLIEDLSYVIESRIPESAEERLSVSDDDEYSLMKLKDDLRGGQKWYRILFSFREEYLPNFESLKERIPSVFYQNNRLHLEPFDVDTAASVISKISAISVEIDNAICNHLARVLAKTNDGSHFRNEAPPFLLSLVCQQIYLKIIQKDASVLESIEREDPGIVNNVAATYCKETFRNVGARTRRFVENRLITSDGRRTMFAVADITKKGVRKDIGLLSSQAHTRYLATLTYFDTEHVEILHDRLVPPLDDSRKKRRLRESIYIYSSVTLIVAIVAAIAVWQINLGAEKNKKKIAAYDKFIKYENKRIINSLDANIEKNSVGALLYVAHQIKEENSAFGGNFQAITDLKDSLMEHLKGVAVFWYQPDSVSFIYFGHQGYRYHERNHFVYFDHFDSGNWLQSDSIKIPSYAVIGGEFREDDSIIYIHYIDNLFKIYNINNFKETNIRIKNKYKYEAQASALRGFFHIKNYKYMNRGYDDIYYTYDGSLIPSVPNSELLAYTHRYGAIYGQSHKLAGTTPVLSLDENRIYSFDSELLYVYKLPGCELEKSAKIPGITDMKELDDRKLLLGTKKGLVLYDKSSNSWKSVEDSLLTWGGRIAKVGKGKSGDKLLLTGKYPGGVRCVFTNDSLSFKREVNLPGIDYPYFSYLVESEKERPAYIAVFGHDAEARWFYNLSFDSSLLDTNNSVYRYLDSLYGKDVHFTYE